MIEENDISGLDPGIRKTVVWLNENGFYTMDSGDGVTKIANGYNNHDDDQETGEALEVLKAQDALDFPHVFMSVRPIENLVSEALRLTNLLNDKGIELVGTQPIKSDDGPNIVANFEPANGFAVLMLYHVNDNLLFPNKT